MNLRDRLNDSLKQAMREKDSRRVNTLRLVLAAVKDRDIANRSEADEREDDQALQDILSKMVNQREEAAQAYEEAGRLELAEKERAEIAIIKEFLPRQLSDSEIREACKEAVDEVQAESLKDIGRTMGVLKSRYAGCMDFAKASREVKDILGAGR